MGEKITRETVAELLQEGDVLQRGEWWWRVTFAAVCTPRISAPFVALQCIDHKGEIQDFTLPADQPIIVWERDGWFDKQRVMGGD